MRSDSVRLVYDVHAHPWIVSSAVNESDTLPEALPWIRERMPNTRVWVSWASDVVELSFISERDAVEFRLRWG